MSAIDDDLNDDLSDLIGAPTKPRPVTPPAHYQPRTFTEGCPKCGGSGKFIGRNGRVLGDCFACKGKGKFEFKTSPEERAGNHAKAAVKRTSKARELEETIKAWSDAHRAETEWLGKQAAFQMTRPEDKRFGFPIAMVEAIGRFGGLTEGQLAKVRELMVKDDLRRAEREAAKPAIDATKLEQAFKVAEERARRPGQQGIWIKPLPLTSGEITVVFQPGSIGSAFAGMIFAKTLGGKKLGHIKAGKFAPKFECSPAETAAVLDCCQDPHKAAKAFGKAFSKCCVCGQTLTNDESIARGIGPICASNFGWGA
jgi:hypothetical protein